MLKTPFSILILLALIVSTLGPLPVQAQEFILPKPGVRVHLSPSFNPPTLKGIKVHPDNPFQFDFILDKGDRHLNDALLKEESTKLIKYFMASVTVPEEDLWVNLSPYEKDRIVPESFGQTEMGRDLLAQDYLLKQITSSLMYPEDEIGKKFWKRIYEQAAKKFGTTQIPVNTFNKVWIVPEKSVVYENNLDGAAYVIESKLKVMLESDYLASAKNQAVSTGPVPAATPLTSVSGAAINDETLRPYKSSELGKLAPAVYRAPASGPPVPISNKTNDELSENIIREIILPELEKEINEGKNFAQLRQVYNSLILATWYKKKIKDSVLSQVYADKNKVSGVNINDSEEKQTIYQQYLQAFKKGVYNYVKEEKDPLTQQILPRKYFSGGFGFARHMNLAMTSVLPKSFVSKLRSTILMIITAGVMIAPRNQVLAQHKEVSTNSSVNSVEIENVSLDGLLKEFNDALTKNSDEGIRKVIAKAGLIKNESDRLNFYLTVSRLNNVGIVQQVLRSILHMVKANKALLTEFVINHLKETSEIFQSYKVASAVRIIEDILTYGQAVESSEILLQAITGIQQKIIDTSTNNLTGAFIDQQLMLMEALFSRANRAGYDQKLFNIRRNEVVDQLNNVLIAKGFFIQPWHGFDFTKDDRFFILSHIDQTVMVQIDQENFSVYILTQITPLPNAGVIDRNAFLPSHGKYGLVNSRSIAIDDSNRVGDALANPESFNGLQNAEAKKLYLKLLKKAFEGKDGEFRQKVDIYMAIRHETIHKLQRMFLMAQGNNAILYWVDEPFDLLQNLSIQGDDSLNGADIWGELARMLFNAGAKNIEEALEALTETTSNADMMITLSKWVDTKSPEEINRLAAAAAQKFGNGKWKAMYRVNAPVIMNSFTLPFSKISPGIINKAMISDVGISPINPLKEDLDFIHYLAALPYPLQIISSKDDKSNAAMTSQQQYLENKIGELAGSQQTYGIEGISDLYETVARYLGITQGSAVDVGSGTNGRPAKGLAKAGLDVILVDNQEELNDITIYPGLKITKRPGTALSLPLANSSQDIVMFNQSLTFINNPEKALQEALRVLKLGGWILIKPGDHRSEGQRIDQRPQELKQYQASLEKLGITQMKTFYVPGTETPVFMIASRAQTSTGGIDLTPDQMNMQVKSGSPTTPFGDDKGGIKFNLDPAQLAQLQNAPGFSPVIINMKPLTDINAFLGLKEILPDVQ